MLGNPLLLPMIMKNVECRMLARTRVKNLQRDVEKPMIDESSSRRWDFGERAGDHGRENTVGVLLAEKRPLPRKRVMNSIDIVPSAYLLSTLSL